MEEILKWTQRRDDCKQVLGEEWRRCSSDTGRPRGEGAWKRRKRKTETEGGKRKRKAETETEISQLCKVNDHYHSVFFAVVKVDSRRCICKGVLSLSI